MDSPNETIRKGKSNFNLKISEKNKFGISRSLIGDEEMSGGINSLINPNKAIIRSSFAFDLRKRNRIPNIITKYIEF